MLSTVHESDFDFSYLTLETSAPGVTGEDITHQQKSRRLWFLFFQWLLIGLRDRCASNYCLINSQRNVAGFFFSHRVTNHVKLSVDHFTITKKKHAHFSLTQREYLTYVCMRLHEGVYVTTHTRST